MSFTGIEAIDTSLQKTNIWLKEIGEDLALDTREQAWTVLRLGLHVLRDRLQADEVTQLGAQLPLIIRGMYFEGWTLRNLPGRSRRTIEFLQSMRRFVGSQPGLDAEQAIRAVFGALTRHVTDGEIDDIKGGLPKEIRELWPAPM